MAIVDRIYNAAFGTKDELEIAEPTSKDFAPDFKDCTSCRVLGNITIPILSLYLLNQMNTDAV